MEVKRGDLVTIALSGDFGKPRPALVIQDDAFRDLELLTVLRVSSELRDWPLFRVTIEPSSGNGLQKRSQVMIDKAATVRKTRVGRRIGYVSTDIMKEVDQALARFFGIAAD